MKDTDNKKKENEWYTRRGACLLLMTLQIIVCITIYKFVLPFLKQKQFFHILGILFLWLVLMGVCEFLIRKIADKKLEGFTCLCVGLFILSVVFGDFLKSIGLMMGIALVNKGTHVLSWDDGFFFSEIRSLRDMWHDIVKK